jgi:hypothetical protein
MTTGRVWTLLVTALVVNAMLLAPAGTRRSNNSPPRQVIGVEAFSAYSQAGDLRTGVAWYATLGIAAAVLALAATLLALVTGRGLPAFAGRCSWSPYSPPRDTRRSQRWQHH